MAYRWLKESRLRFVVLCFFLVYEGAANADTLSLPSIIQSQCMGCHQMEAKRVGPPFMRIAERYGTGDRDATRQYLQQQIRQGSRGNWGAIPMPAQNKVSQAQAAELAEWLLGLTSARAQE